jgi:hypothetical protein
MNIKEHVIINRTRRRRLRREVNLKSQKVLKFLMILYENKLWHRKNKMLLKFKQRELIVLSSVTGCTKLYYSQIKNKNNR